MKDSHWGKIHRVFRTRDRLFSSFRSPVADASEEGGFPGSIREPGLEDLVLARAGIREALEGLREALSGEIGERDLYYILFPIVAHLDEGVQTRYMGPDLSGGWAPLQRELFDTDAAGVLFYETLEDLLLKPQTLPLVFEVYYFCLHDGFCGRMVSNPAKRQEYMERLRIRIPTADLTEIFSHGGKTVGPASSEDEISPLWLYGGALTSLLLFYFFLKFLGAHWNPVL
ncbi:DotU family type IV/VI secretion system protein [Desulfobotulus sp.]|jgi:type IV/VI secretion system ImpK/VasF family protein|uniref:DotU family type IV/VI secretion system protein n=1 Tax=Desulfobotulus sp. TaxID=1940337 RepID=UPI002A364F42|nr:DotU family type IV/VI secretion system protein [Desulfobotulus sp.]MDY0162852.1 DotU family type IV/VI secretion system protein [Desulfobotulus sp.]